MAWAEAYLHHTKWRPGSLSNRMWPGRRPTSVPSSILIHPAVWPQYMGRKLGGGCCAPLLARGSWVSIHHNVSWAKAYLRTKWHLHPFSRLATTDMGRKWGAVPLGGRAGSPSNTMWPGQRPTSMPSFILIHPTVWPQYTNVIERTDRTDRKTVR